MTGETGPLVDSTTSARAAEVITPSDIRGAQDRIRPYLRRTPVVRVALAELAGAELPGPEDVLLKLEQLQVSGSFKGRGAFANLLLREIPRVGVVAASGGNHGVAVAYAAHRLGIPAKIFVPEVSAPAKIARIRELGADLVVAGDRYADALAGAQEWATRSGALSVHAFDQRETLLGQAGVGVELDEQVTDLDTVLVPVGGGGLIAGIAGWFAGRVRVVGVEPDGAPTLSRARAHGTPVDAPTGSIAADALAPRRVGELVFPITQRHVHDVVLVEDEAIRHAQWRLWQAARVVAEPAASVGVAALLSGTYRPLPGERVAVVLSGANTTPGDLVAPSGR